MKNPWPRDMHASVGGSIVDVMALTTSLCPQVGCGADELIDLLIRCVLEPGDAIIDCPPTFGMYAFDSDVNAGRVITIPRLPETFALDVPAIIAAVHRENPKILFLTSPNNPDGSLIAEEELLELLKLPVLVVLDEAYIEFSDRETKMPWVTEVPNLIIFRTFSKSAGLAGLRVGYVALCCVRDVLD
jgi:histidinol-phosphate aminotransferase